MRRIAILMLLLACDSGGATPTVLHVTDLAGSYRVTFVRAANQNPNFSCQVISLDLGAPMWLPDSCTNSLITPASPWVSLRSDSLVLEVVTTIPGSRDIILWEFSGTIDNARAQWVGATCTDTPSLPDGFCMREGGTATLRRR